MKKHLFISFIISIFLSSNALANCDFQIMDFGKSKNDLKRVINFPEEAPLFSMEDYVLNYMTIEGIQNVRGSIYINSYISPETETLIISKMNRTHVPIDCADYYEESESEMSSRTSSESIGSNHGLISRAYRWFCFKKIKNSESKVALID